MRAWWPPRSSKPLKLLTGLGGFDSFTFRQPPPQLAGVGVGVSAKNENPFEQGEKGLNAGFAKSKESLQSDLRRRRSAIRVTRAERGYSFGRRLLLLLPNN